MTEAEASGRDSAFWDFYKKTATDAHRRAFVLANGHLHDAEDAQQDAYILVMRRWHVVVPLSEAQQRAYLLTCLLNVFRQRWRRRDVEQMGLDGIDPQAVLPEIADHVIAAGEYRRACRAIAELPPQQARTLTLYAIEGLETREIADQLAIAEATVRGHLRAARAALLTIRDTR